MFVFDEINNKKILKSTLITKPIHFFTTRETVITHNDIDEYKLLADINKKEIAEYLNIRQDRIITPQQTHSANISVAKYDVTYPQTDALIVEDPNIAIALNFADCTPVILYDEGNNIGAVVHAGWKGTAAAIVSKTVDFMEKKYFTNPQNISAVIGPAISMKNYQVDESVFLQLKNTLNNEYNDYFKFDEINKKYYVDLKTINLHQLQELGVQRIDKCEYCTYDSIDVFFSYRRENGITARHSAILKLN